MRRVIYVAGLPVALISDVGWSPAVELLFGGCPTATSPAILEIVVADESPPRPQRDPDVAEPDHVDLWFDPDGLVVFEQHGVGAVARGATVVAGGGGDARSWRLVVQYALVDAMARLGRHAVHGAALARDGQVVLALGAGGAGKSTLAFAAWRRGWQVLTDDLVWLHREDAAVMAAGFPKPLAVPDDLMTAPPGGAVPIAGDARHRWILPYQAVTTGPALPVAGVAIVGHGTGEGALEPASSGPELLATLMRSHPLVTAGRVAKDFFPVAAAVSRLPAISLRHHPDAGRRADRAGELLDEAFRGFVALQ
jgi:hypothetical protein